MPRGKHIYDQRLTDLYNELNVVCFEGELPDPENGVSVFFNTGLRRTLGFFRYNRRTSDGHLYNFKIEMNYQAYGYKAICMTDDKLNDIPVYNGFTMQAITTLVHEMVHFQMALVHGFDVGHSKIWQNAFMKAIAKCEEYFHFEKAKSYDFQGKVDNQIKRQYANASVPGVNGRGRSTYKYKIECPVCGWSRKMKNKTEWVSDLLKGNARSHKSHLTGRVCHEKMRVTRIYGDE